MSTPVLETGIPFAFIVELVEAIAKIKPRKASEKQPRSTRYVDTPAYKTFRRWVETLRRVYAPLPPDTAPTVFRLLFPEEDRRRKYGLQETRLAEHLVKILGVSSGRDGRGARLKRWGQDGNSGCLGEEVRKVMAASAAHSQASTASAISIRLVDELLTELAGRCPFSDSAVRPSKSMTTTTAAAAPSRSREAILTALYTALAPAEAAVVTQVILKDLRPVMYPVAAAHYTEALLHYKSNAVTYLTKEAAMHAWDPSGRMAVMYTIRANLEDAARTFEQFKPGDALPTPECGKQILIPKCAKGQGTAQALHYFQGADKVWVETKYDGERAQIHVRLDEHGKSHIKIFSKSGRDSTLDRAGIHGVICDALGLGPHADSPPCFTQNIIVEAEMVAFSDVLNRIDEFWRIRSLIATTAIGVRHKSLAPEPPSDLGSQASLISNGADGGTRHLALVFFDILLVDGYSLLSCPYSERRSVLEQVIRVAPGYSMLAERTCIDMTHAAGAAAATLRNAFANLISGCEEGAVLKADGASYRDWRWPWVKLKRDYIKGYGDTVDLVLLAAGWEKDRGRELVVGPAVYTTFYFGALANVDEYKTKPSCRPHFEIFFTASYCMSREQLEDLNFVIRSMDPVSVSNQGQISEDLPYSYNLYSKLHKPAIFLSQPLLAEVLGAGFTKAQGSLFYEPRFARISKFHRPSDRPWSDGVCLKELQQIARTVVGRDRPGKAEDDWARAVFRPDEPASPGVRCPKKRKQAERLWIEKLEVADGVGAGRASPSKRARVDGAGARRVAQDVENAENGLAGPMRGGGAGADVFASGAGGNENEDQPEREEMAGSGSERARMGLACSGSVTNLAASSLPPPPSSSPLQRFSERGSPSHTPLRRQTKPLVQRGRSPSPGRVKTPRPSPVVASQAHPPLVPAAALPQLPRTPPPTVAKAAAREARHVALDLDPETDTKPSMSPPPPHRMSSPPTLHQFLQDSVVWLARASGSSRPSWRAPSRAVVPVGSQVSTLDAVFVACGWDAPVPCSWAKQGVVFVDVDGDAAKAEHVLGELAIRRKTLLEGKYAWRARPILILDMKMLAYDALEKCLTQDEVQARAICRFG